jgi:hypothetical protein
MYTQKETHNPEPNGKAQHALKVPRFYFIYLVPNMFLSSSQRVPIKFSICSLGS